MVVFATNLLTGEDYALVCPKRVMKNGKEVIVKMSKKSRRRLEKLQKKAGFTIVEGEPYDEY